MASAPPAAEASRRPGRPRSEAARTAILAAALDELVAHGILGTSIEAVAARAGVSKATIYRWWPDKVALALDALWGLPELEVPDTGSLEQDMVELRTALLALISSTALGDVLPVLAAERRRSEHREAVSHYVAERAAPFRLAVERAVERGELPSGIDVELVADLLAAPLSHSILFRDAPLDERRWREVVQIVSTGIGRST